MEDTDFRDKMIVLALVRFAGVNSRALDWLLKRFSTPHEIMKAGSKELSEYSNISSEISERITTVDKKLEAAEKFYKKLQARDIKVISRLDTAYPERLFELNDPPALFYLRGSLPENDKRTVAIVGASQATAEGIALTSKLSAAFSKAGVQIVSSFGKGIDYAVHLGSKAAGGASLAVLDAGFDHINSETDMPLAIDLVRSGGLLSEYAPDIKFSKTNYRESNRIIVGLSQAVVITEIYEDSKHTHDILKFCHQIGKLVFFLVGSENGALSDEKSLAKIARHGAIPMAGLKKIDDIISSLV
ncbi:MAG: DNA-processing protein DprA [candidate division Zixibacteria bacterium]